MNIFFDGEICDIEANFINKVIETREDINLYFKTQGGVVETGLALYDIIRNKKNVKIIAYGRVESIGIPILLSSPNRSAYKHTRFMVHKIKTKNNNFESIDIAKSILHNAEELQNNIKKIILNHTTGFYDMLEKIFNSDEQYYFGAEEALKYGFIKEII